MISWRVEQAAEDKSLAEMKIQRNIFQGDALSPLLFVIVMMPLNRILRIQMKSGKRQMTEGIELLNQKN